jgi:hypothetical protein
MKHSVLFSLAVLAAFGAAPLVVRADANPHFDEDARPILRMQPDLLEYVHAHFDVKNTGTAKYPGDDDHRPQPPYIFRARPLGSSGPYNLRLLIQPGPRGHILNVVDMTKVHLNAPGSPPMRPAPPSVANQAPPQQQQPEPPPAAPETPPAPAQAPEPANPPPTPSQPSAPTSDTPSGPIMDSGSPSGGASSSSSPNLAPPPDPAPASQ